MFQNCGWAKDWSFPSFDSSVGRFAAGRKMESSGRRRRRRRQRLWRRRRRWRQQKFGRRRWRARNGDGIKFQWWTLLCCVIFAIKLLRLSVVLLLLHWTRLQIRHEVCLLLLKVIIKVKPENRTVMTQITIFSVNFMSRQFSFTTFRYKV